MFNIYKIEYSLWINDTNTKKQITYCVTSESMNVEKFIKKFKRTKDIEYIYKIECIKNGENFVET